MKSWSVYLLIAVSFLLLISCNTLPESYAVPGLFDSIDENNDGRITRKEFKDDMKEHVFEKLDADADNVVEIEEWKALENIPAEEKHIELFDRIDKDKDKRISFFEFSDYADRKSNLEEAFIGLDRDGSNSLSSDEITVRPLFKMLTIRF